MRKIVRKVLPLLAALMLLAGQIEPSAAIIIGQGGSRNETPVSYVRTQKSPALSGAAEDEILEDRPDSQNAFEEDFPGEISGGREEKPSEGQSGEIPGEADLTTELPAKSAGETSGVLSGESSEDLSVGQSGDSEQDAGQSGNPERAVGEKTGVPFGASEQSDGGKTGTSSSGESGQRTEEESVPSPEKSVQATGEEGSGASSGGSDQMSGEEGSGASSGGSDQIIEEESGALSGESDQMIEEETGVSSDEPEQIVEARVEDRPGEQEEVTITLSGGMPEGAEAVAAEAVQQAEAAGLGHVLCAYDITINDGWQPQEALEVTISRWDLPDGVRVFHIGEDGSPEEVDVARSEDGEVVFAAEGFSIYAVTEDLARRTYEFMDYKYGAWLPYEFDMSLPGDPEDPGSSVVISSSRQILCSGDSLVVPAMPDKDGMRFLGWYTSPTVDVSLMAPERGGVKKDITADSIVTLYARYGIPAVITYYARPQSPAGNQVFDTQTVFLPEAGGSVQVDLSEQIHPEAPASGQGFLGWAEAGSAVTVDQEHFTVSGDVSLYPVFGQLFEISFSTEEGTEYIAPVQAGTEGISGRLTDHVPLRDGYSFSGWAAGDLLLTDAEGKLLDEDVRFPEGTLSGGVLRLTGDLVLRSVWIPLEVQYRVVFWAEKASDTKKLVFSDNNDGADENGGVDGNAGGTGMEGAAGGWSVPEDRREYDFVGSLRVSAPAGTVVSGESLRESYGHLEDVSGFSLEQGDADFTGLCFRALRDVDGCALDSLEVKGGGTDTVHVYYDRRVVTLRFNYPEDVEEETPVTEAEYFPSLPESGTVTQKAVTCIRRADYPEDVVLTGLYGGLISDGFADDGSAAVWPVSYTVGSADYTLTTRTMQYSNGRWQQKSSSSAARSEDALVLSTRWVSQDGKITDYQETFGKSTVLVPSQTMETLRQEGDTGCTVAYYRESEQAAYPASPVYYSSPALTYSALEGETVVVGSPFSGYELDYFTYTDSRGTPIRREADASEEQRTLAGGSFTGLKVYCRRIVRHIIFHNGGEEPQEGPGVKYSMGLSTDYVKQSIAEPSLPDGLEGREDELEFSGWYLDKECTIYLDLAGLKAAGRASLLLQYDWIQSIVSVYDYRSSGENTVPALRMGDSDLHLFAGWTVRRVLVRLEPDGGELPEDVPTFFWKNCGETLGLLPVSRDYVPAGQGQEVNGQSCVYHIHTYEQYLKDNDASDRTARYSPAGEEDGGNLYTREAGSFRFLGWFLVEEGADGKEVLHPFDHESPLSGDVRLRAQWSRLGVYRVVYDPGLHGRLTGSEKSALYRDHASIALGGDVTPEEGYVFVGWRIRRPDGSGELMDTLYSSGDKLVINADWAEITMDEYDEEPRGVITLEAQYEHMTASSITYYVNGGVFTGPGREEVESDPALAQELAEKLRKDYGPSAAHRYLYDDGGTVIGYTVTGIEQNASLTTEDGSWFQRSGYKLMGWSYDPEGEVELALHVGGFNAARDPGGVGHVLYAVWKPERQVIYNLQGGSWNTSNGPEYRQEEGNWIYGAGSGEQAPVPQSPTKAGYAFAGWNRSSTAKKGLQTMPNVTKSVTLYAIWTASVVLRFDTGGGRWESLTGNLCLLAPDTYGMIVSPGNTCTLPAGIPVKEGEYLFRKWEEGSYQYDAGETFKTSAEQSGQTLTLTALWSEGVPAVEVLVNADGSLTIGEEESLIGATEDGSEPIAPREIEGYQFLFTVYDEVPGTVEDIAEHYRVTGILRLGENSYQVKLANGRTAVRYTDSIEKLQAVYIQNRQLDVCLKRMNVFEDGMDEMNLTLTSLGDGPYTSIEVGKVNIQKALPKPGDYAKAGSTAYRSYTYAIGHCDAETMHDIDTMTKDKLWIRQTLGGFAFSVNGEEWKDLDREAGDGKDVAVYIIYDNRVETPTTINHTVYGLKSDKDQLFTYQIYVRGRWGFNIGKEAYFLHKPDDPSEELNSYTVALHDGEKVLIPLHIDYLTGQKQYYKPGDLFYDMFGGDYPTTIDNRSELRIWQEVEMRRMSELPFTRGSFETAIEMRSLSGNSHNAFNGYDEKEHLWLKQLGISKYYVNTFSHSFIYTRTSLDVPVHVLELTQDGLVPRDGEWLRGGSADVSVTAQALTVGEELAGKLTDVPGEYSLQNVCFGLSRDDLSGSDSELILRLAAERNDPTLLHVYDYENADDAADASTRTIVPDGSGIYLVYGRHSSVQVPVEYVRQDSSGEFTPVDLSGYGLVPPTVTVTDSEAVDFRSLPEIAEVNDGIRKLDAFYLTGRMMLADRKGSVLSVYQPGEWGDWDSGRALELVGSEAGLVYTGEDDVRQFSQNAKVWIELANNTPLRITGRLWQRGCLDKNTGVIPYLPRDGKGRVTAVEGSDPGKFTVVGETFPAFTEYIPYASDEEAEYLRASMGGVDSIVAAAYCTDENGYRHWYWQEAEGAEPRRVDRILYADYASYWSPVNVRYVLPMDLGGYAEVEDLEEEVKARTVSVLKVDREGLLLSDAIAESLEAIDRGSALYRTAGRFALASADLKMAYFTAGHAEIRLVDGMDGLTYETSAESGEAEDPVRGTLTGGNYPDLLVLLRPIATLVVSKKIDDAGGYAHWDDVFSVTIRVEEGDGGIEGDYLSSSGPAGSMGFAVRADSGGETVHFENGRAEISLGHGREAAIYGLPRGARVIVEENPGGVYLPSYRIVQGARKVSGNDFVLDRHTTVEIVNTSIDITQTGKDFADGPAYALLLGGAAVYAAYLLLKKRKRRVRSG